MFEVGQPVSVRGRSWVVVDSRNHEQPDGRTITTLVCSAEGKGATDVATFFHPPEAIEARTLPPVEFRLDGSEPEWRRFHQAFTFSMALGGKSLAALGMSRVAFEPCQLVPVKKALALPRPRLLIADDVGLGKTIEAGLVLIELMARGRADRVLVVTPAGLQLQWQEELADKFGLAFKRFDSSGIADLRSLLPARANAWQYYGRVITSIDFLKRPDVRRALDRIRFDLVIVDEAHYLSESGSAADVRRTQRSRLGTFLAERTDGLLLLTATPHNGFTEGFGSLVRLCEPTVLARGAPLERSRIAPHVVRRLKSQILRDGQPMYRPPEIERVSLRLSPAERRLYKAVDAYARRVWKSSRGNPDRAAAGFAMTVLKKRLLSSTRAIRESLKTRRDSLARDSVDVRKNEGVTGQYVAGVPLTEQQEERAQTILLSAAADPADLDTERTELEKLIALAESLDDQTDTKAQRLLEFVNERLAREPDSKVIVFTEFRDTLNSLRETFTANGFDGAISILHGGMDTDKRREVEKHFALPQTRVLLATDAASEGINLQDHCHAVVHNELPWNPNRLEQRNGRVDRYGQREQVQVYNLFIEDSLDDHILEVLLGKLKRIRDELGSTANVLGVEIDVESGVMTSGGLAGETADADKKAQETASQVDHMVDSARAQFEAWEGAAILAGELESSDLDNVSSAHVFPDSTELESWITELLRREGARVDAVDAGIFALDIPGKFQRSEVRPRYGKATFHHRVAVAEGNTDVEFLTPRHPLVRAILEDVRSRLYDPRFAHRVAYRVVSGSEPGLLVCHLGRFSDARGSTIEERFISVFVSVDGQSGSPEADEWLYVDKGTRENVPSRILETTFAGQFASLLEVATEEALRRAQAAADEITADLTHRATRLMSDLDNWAENQELYLKQQLLKVREAGGQQLTLGLDEDSDRAAVQAMLRSRETRLRNELDHLSRDVASRRARIEQGARAKVAGLTQLGALMVVPRELLVR